jgi:hypothetical protein
VPSKPDVEGLLRKHLGKEVADAILIKIDKMVAKGASPAKMARLGSACKLICLAFVSIHPACC